MIYSKFILRIISFVLLLMPLSVRAEGFVVTPMMQEVSLSESDREQIIRVSVKNETTAEVKLEISVLDFGSLDESGGVALLGATGDLERHYSLARWMQPQLTELKLSSGEQQSVEVKIVNQPDLSPGGHYGAVVFQNVSSAKTNVPSVAINQIFTSLILLKKTGGIRVGLELESVKYQNRWFAFEHTVVPSFKNTGNVHIAPRGELSVTDPLGRLTARGILNEGSGIILPESGREFPLKLFPVARALVPGVYTLEFSYRFDGQSETAQWSRTFFLFPLAVSAGLAGGAVILGVYFFWRRRLHARFQENHFSNT